MRFPSDRYFLISDIISGMGYMISYSRLISSFMMSFIGKLMPRGEGKYLYISFSVVELFGFALKLAIFSASMRLLWKDRANLFFWWGGR